MLTRRIIGCLDVREGRVVKGVRFQDLRDAGAPADCAARYEADGADEIVVLDVSATAEQRAAAVTTVAAVRRALSIPLTVGGGLRSTADAAAMLNAGADKVALNTAAVRDPGLIKRLADRFGSQCVTVSIDAKRSAAHWHVVVNAGTSRTERSATAWARQATDCGAGEILLTSIDCDGTRSGYDTALIRAVAHSVTAPVVASGGAGSAADLIAGIESGADAVLVASLLHDGLATVATLKSSLAAAGQEVRQ